MDGKWVFGGIERITGRCFFKVVPDRSKECLLSVINEFILPGTTIVSDYWKSYDCLYDEGFGHIRVNHSLHFKDPETGAHTNKIEGTWSAIKRGLNSNKTKDGLDYYLAEYVWRKKNMHKKNLFLAFIDSILRVYPPLTADKPKG
jgi:transposase-like protein